LYRRIYKISMENPENPKCNRCKKKWKPDDTDIKKNGDVNKSCKKCREYRKNNKEKQAEINKKWYENNKEKVAEYNKKYKEENKEKIKEEAKKYREINKEKQAEYIKEYYENNKEKIKERVKYWCEDNKDKIIEYRKQYREENKEKIAEHMKEYREENKCDHNKERRFCKICNLNMYLVNLNRGNINRVLKSSSQNKTKSSIDYLGCDTDYFINYFKKKMDLWNENNEIKMNWDNIHLDHIKPVSSFNLDDENEFNNCCNYTNFQPLLIEDNLRKNNKWTGEDEVYWNENIINKEHFGIYKPV